ncbi:mok12 [Symbiodinium sp. CCMP2592]|nr:mok12 [Symbiodinium sp. CCMP2592]
MSADLVDSLSAEFPVHVMCSSRWPIFEAVELFTMSLGEKEHALAGLPDDACDGVSGGVLNWRQLRQLANEWSRQRMALGVGLDEERRRSIMRAMVTAMGVVLDNWDKAMQECPIGCAFLAGLEGSIEIIRSTRGFAKYSNALDKVIHEGLLSAVSCGWPLGYVLAQLSDMNKGKRYADRNYKYMRNFADLDLHLQELSPLVRPPDSGQDVSTWRRQGARKAVALARLPWTHFRFLLHTKARHRRRILREALQAIARLTSRRATKSRAMSGGVAVRRHVALTLLYGSSWIHLLERTVLHLERLHFAWPLLVVSIGKDAFKACRRLQQKSSSVRVGCWRPNTPSQVHRFTIIHILLHVGVDVFYFDMDTFFLKNPLPTLLSQARKGKHETMFSGHGDGDCINIGVFYIKATFRMTEWFSRFLDWYHEHQYEIDQRGLDVMLGSPLQTPEGELGVAFPPENLPKVRVGVMEDENEVVIGFIGWYGHVSRMLVFHWCNSPLKDKWEEINAVYDAAEAIEAWMPLSLAMSAVSTRHFRVLPREPSEPWSIAATGKSPLGGPVWRAIATARQVIEAYRLPKPLVRLPCN